MTWSEAIEAMRAGLWVERSSGRVSRPLSNGVVEHDEEACMLAHAWTPDEEPTQVFMGVHSRCLFVPDDDHRWRRIG